jgi:hypothetical protein
MEFHNNLIILIVILIIILIPILLKFFSTIINLLPKIHENLYVLRNKLKKKNFQHYFYGIERFNKFPNIFGKRYIKLNNYIFKLDKQEKKIEKKIDKKFHKIIIIFYSRTSKYFHYIIDKLNYNRFVEFKSINFFKFDTLNKKRFIVKTKDDDLLLKTFYIKKKTKKKLVLILLIDGLSNHFSNQFFHTKKFFGTQNKLENVWSNSAWTLPTWSNLITGSYTSNHLNYLPRSYYSSNPKNEKLSSSIKSKSTIFELFQKNNFVTASYSPYPRINPTYNFDRGVDIMKYCEGQNNNEILNEIRGHIELFNDTSNFIVAHLMDLHHSAKGFKELADFSNFSDKNFNYQNKINEKSYSNNFKKAEFVEPKNFHEEKDLQGIIKSTDKTLNFFLNYLSEKKFDDFTIILLGDHGTRLNKFTLNDDILNKYHQNIGFFIKDKKNRSFNSKKNKIIETIDIFPSLLSRYGLTRSKSIINEFDGRNTIFSNHKKNYHLAESIYDNEYNILVNSKKIYLYSSYLLSKKTIKKKLNYKYLSEKNELINSNSKNKLLKKLDNIEKKHIKRNKLKKNEK